MNRNFFLKLQRCVCIHDRKCISLENSKNTRIWSILIYRVDVVLGIFFRIPHKSGKSPHEKVEIHQIGGNPSNWRISMELNEISVFIVIFQFVFTLRLLRTKKPIKMKIATKLRKRFTALASKWSMSCMKKIGKH